MNIMNRVALVLVKLQIVLKHKLIYCNTDTKILWGKRCVLQVLTLHIDLNAAKDITLLGTQAEVLGFVFKYEVRGHCTSRTVIQPLCSILSLILCH